MLGRGSHSTTGSPFLSPTPTETSRVMEPRPRGGTVCFSGTDNVLRE